MNNQKFASATSTYLPSRSQANFGNNADFIQSNKSVLNNSKRITDLLLGCNLQQVESAATRAFNACDLQKSGLLNKSVEVPLSIEMTTCLLGVEISPHYQLLGLLNNIDIGHTAHMKLPDFIELVKRVLQHYNARQTEIQQQRKHEKETLTINQILRDPLRFEAVVHSVLCLLAEEADEEQEVLAVQSQKQQLSVPQSAFLKSLNMISDIFCLYRPTPQDVQQNLLQYVNIDASGRILCDDIHQLVQSVFERERRFHVIGKPFYWLNQNMNTSSIISKQQLPINTASSQSIILNYNNSTNGYGALLKEKPMLNRLCELIFQAADEKREGVLEASTMKSLVRIFFIQVNLSVPVQQVVDKCMQNQLSINNRLTCKEFQVLTYNLLELLSKQEEEALQLESQLRQKMFFAQELVENEAHLTKYTQKCFERFDYYKTGQVQAKYLHVYFFLICQQLDLPKISIKKTNFILLNSLLATDSDTSLLDQSAFESILRELFAYVKHNDILLDSVEIVKEQQALRAIPAPNFETLSDNIGKMFGYDNEAAWPTCEDMVSHIMEIEGHQLWLLNPSLQLDAVMFYAVIESVCNYVGILSPSIQDCQAILNGSAKNQNINTMTQLSNLTIQLLRSLKDVSRNQCFYWRLQDTPNMQQLLNDESHFKFLAKIVFQMKDTERCGFISQFDIEESIYQTLQFFGIALQLQDIDLTAMYQYADLHEQSASLLNYNKNELDTNEIQNVKVTFAEFYSTAISFANHHKEYKGPILSSSNMFHGAVVDTDTRVKSFVESAFQTAIKDQLFDNDILDFKKDYAEAHAILYDFQTDINAIKTKQYDSFVSYKQQFLQKNLQSGQSNLTQWFDAVPKETLIKTSLELDLTSLVSLPSGVMEWPEWFPAFMQSQLPQLRKNLTQLASKLYNNKLPLEVQKSRKELSDKILASMGKIEESKLIAEQRPKLSAELTSLKKLLAEIQRIDEFVPKMVLEICSKALDFLRQIVSASLQFSTQAQLISEQTQVVSAQVNTTYQNLFEELHLCDPAAVQIARFGSTITNHHLATLQPNNVIDERLPFFLVSFFKERNKSLANKLTKGIYIFDPAFFETMLPLNQALHFSNMQYASVRGFTTEFKGANNSIFDVFDSLLIVCSLSSSRFVIIEIINKPEKQIVIYDPNNSGLADFYEKIIDVFKKYIVEECRDKLGLSYEVCESIANSYQPQFNRNCPQISNYIDNAVLCIKNLNILADGNKLTVRSYDPININAIRYQIFSTLMQIASQKDSSLDFAQFI